MNASFRAAFWCLAVALGLPLILFGGAQFLPIDQSKLLALHERNPHWGLHRRVPEHTVPGPVVSPPAPQHQQAEPVMLASRDSASPGSTEEPPTDPTAPVVPTPAPARTQRRAQATLTGTERTRPRANQVTLEPPVEADASASQSEQQEPTGDRPEKQTAPASRTQEQRHVEFRVEPSAGAERDRLDQARLEARLTALQQHLDRLTLLQFEQAQQQRQMDQSQLAAAQRTLQMHDQTNIQNLERQVKSLQVALENSRSTPVPVSPPVPVKPVAPALTLPTELPPAEEQSPSDHDVASGNLSQGDERGPTLRGTASGAGQFTLQCRDADGGETLTLLGKLASRNLVVSRQLTDKVTAHLRNVTFEQALASLTRALGAVTEREGEFLYVLSPGEAETRKNSARRPAAKLYRLHHISAQDIQPLLEPLLTPQTGRLAVTSGNVAGIDEEGAGESLAQRDALLVFDVPEVQQEVEKVLAEMDLPPAQLEIEATILSVQLNEGLRQGVNLASLNGYSSDPGFVQQANCGPEGCLSPATTLQGDPGLKCGRLMCGCRQFVHDLGQIAETQLVANPRVLVLNRQPACLAIGGRFGYRTSNNKKAEVQFVDAGTRLRIRPQISADGLIRLEIHPECSSAVLDLQTGLPKIRTAEVATQVLVPDGQTVVVGGLMEERILPPSPRHKHAGHWPWSKERGATAITSRNELIILITTRIVHDPAATLSTRPASVLPLPAPTDSMSPTLPPPAPAVPAEASRPAKAPGRLTKSQSQNSSVAALPKPKNPPVRAKVSLSRKPAARQTAKVSQPQVVTGAAAAPPETDDDGEEVVEQPLSRPVAPTTSTVSVRLPATEKPPVVEEKQPVDDHRVERALGIPQAEQRNSTKSEPGPVTLLPAPPATVDRAGIDPSRGSRSTSDVVPISNFLVVPAVPGTTPNSSTDSGAPRQRRASRAADPEDSPYSKQPLNLSVEERPVMPAAGLLRLPSRDVPAMGKSSSPSF